MFPSFSDTVLGQAFGQHTNAEISSSLADTDVLMQTMIEVRGGGGEYWVSAMAPGESCFKQIVEILTIWGMYI